MCSVQGKHFLKEYFTRVMQHWHKLPEEVVDTPIPRIVQGWACCGSVQPDLVEDVPAQYGGLE